MNGNSKKYFIIYLSILALAGGVIIYLAASRVGPGVSNDAAMVLSVAENVTKGNGLIDFRGDVLTQFPPIYSLLLALGNLLFGQDVVVVGWIINILVFSAIIWFSGFTFYDTISDEPILAYIGSFVIFSSTSLIKISSNIASDPLFMLLVIFILMSLCSYLSTMQDRYLLLAGILIVLGCFQRYAGLSLAPVGGLVVVYKYRNNIWSAVRSSFLFVVPTAFPIFLWGYLHNYPINASVFGERIPYMPMVNFIAGSAKLLNWFIPVQIISHVGLLYLYITILVLLTFTIFLTGTSGFQSILNSARVIPHIGFLFVYIGVLIFNITSELQGLETDRAHIILLPSLLIILLSIGSRLIKAVTEKFRIISVRSIVILLFLIWSVYPVSKTYSYVERSRVNGDVSSYNSLNKVNIRYTSFANYLSSLNMQNKQFYSNGEAAVWFIIRVQVHSLPKSDSGHRPTQSFLEEHYNGWPGHGNDGYLIWFNSYASKEYLATPEELDIIASVNQVYSDENGIVYSLKSQ
jgi:hypothetical protein